MAGQEIYLGKMIEGLQADMASMSADLLQVVNELQTVNETVGQSIVSGNIKAGDGNPIVINDTDKVASNTTALSVGKVKCFAKGKIKFKANVKTSNTGTASQVHCKINGGADVYLTPINQSAFTEVTADINVNVLDEVEFFIKCGTTGMNVTMQANSGIVSYDIINLVSDGFVIKS